MPARILPQAENAFHDDEYWHTVPIENAKQEVDRVLGIVAGQPFHHLGVLVDAHNAIFILVENFEDPIGKIFLQLYGL